MGGKRNDENQEIAKRFWFGKRNDENQDMAKRLWFGKKNDENQEMAKRFWFGKRNDESEDMEKKRFLFGKREDEPEVPVVTGEENKGGNEGDEEGENVTPEEMKELEELVGEAIVSDAVQE